MPDIDTSFYPRPQNPLAMVQGVAGLANTLQQNQLLQQAQQIRQFEMQKDMANTLIGTIGPLYTQPDVPKSVALGTAASVVKSMGIPSPVATAILQPLIDAPDTPDGRKSAYGNFYSRLAGVSAGQPTSAGVQPGTYAPILAPLSQAAGMGPRLAGPGPATSAALTSQGGISGTNLGNSQTEAADYQRQVTPLQNAIPALERLGQTGTGPGKDEINTLKSIAVSFGFAPKNWVGSVQDFDEAKKYLIDQARQLGNTSTNDQLAASFSANPSTKMSNAAAVDVAKTLLSLRRMKHMQVLEFQNSGLPPEQYGQWAAQWNAQHDPRAFGFDQMTVPQRKQVLQTVKNMDLFKQDVQDAKEAGVLKPQ